MDTRRDPPASLPQWAEQLYCERLRLSLLASNDGDWKQRNMGREQPVLYRTLAITPELYDDNDFTLECVTRVAESMGLRPVVALEEAHVSLRLDPEDFQKFTQQRDSHRARRHVP